MEEKEEKKVSYVPKKEQKKKKAKIVLVKPNGALIVSIDGNNQLLGVEESKKHKNVKIGDEININV